jgi:hypothetical protein
MRGRGMSVKHLATNVDSRCHVGQVTPIDVLHDDVLLVIFDFYVTVDGYQITKRAKEAWQSLVHVCRRWRCVVFASPRRLNLRLVCSPGTPARECLDVWPALPLIVEGTISSTSVDNIVVALGHSDRVCQIDLRITAGLQWDQVLAAMQVPFPALTRLFLLCESGLGRAPVIPDTFLGGSAPHLRNLDMDCISFPGIPNLLLSATHLVRLDLSDVPLSGYISPEEMASCLSVLTSLDDLSLSLEFLYSRSPRSLPPITRFILFGLTWFWFKGPSEYLDDLVARIDAPRLDRLRLAFPDQMNFDNPHLVQFISRTPTFEGPNETHVTFNLDAAVRLLWASDSHGRLCVEIIGEDSDPQVSSIAQVFAMCLPRLPTVENLRLGVFTEDLFSELDWKDDVRNEQWLELLRPFTAVKNLYLSEEFQPNIASALQELVGGRTAEVLPFLQNIFLAKFESSRSFQEDIGQFVTARQLSGHPIAILPL